MADETAPTTPVDIWAEISPELKAAYDERAAIITDEEALHARKVVNAETIRTLEAAHVEQHSAGGEPQVIQGDIAKVATATKSSGSTSPAFTQPR